MKYSRNSCSKKKTSSMDNAEKWGATPLRQMTEPQLRWENRELRKRIQALYDENYKLRQRIADADLRLKRENRV